ncbi:MAG: SMC-Scp complex subunit ScpB [Bacilli bacterium]|nr:SMC-Scp complex subunit ScpB [Bacilli bacterium]
MEGILEGLLYVQGDNGLTLKEVMSILGIGEEEAKELVYKLKINYEQENRGLRLSYLGNTFKLTTKQEHKDYYEKLLESPSSHVLSQAALEVLAIVAYNEPITRGQVDEMRGVDSAFMIRKLLAKGLIKEAGKSDLPGHPTLYKTTDDFLDYFGLATKDDLPDISEIEIEDSKEKDLFRSNYREVEEE